MNDLNTSFLANPYNSNLNPKSILKDSFRDLWGKNIPDLKLKSEEVKMEYRKYHYLLLNKLYFDKNELEYTRCVLDNSVKKSIKHNRWKVLWLLSSNRREKIEDKHSSIDSKKINEKLISYPLFYMWEYVKSNLEYLKTWNDKQIEFAEKFWLSHMQDIKNIVEILWFNDVLSWSNINLPLEKFKWLKVELESAEMSWIMLNINWNSLLLSFATSLKIENYENLYYATVALWYKEKMWVSNVKMPTMRMNRILFYANQNFWKPNLEMAWSNVVNLLLTEDAVQKIFQDNLGLFTKEDVSLLKASQIAQIKSNIRSALRGFWYRLEIDNYRA